MLWTSYECGSSLEEVAGGEVEEEECVERQRDGRVVDQSDVDVALGDAGIKCDH